MIIICKILFYSELSIETPIREKKGKYMNSSDEDFENVLLLAVENQNNDLLYTNKAKDKEKPPAKLHVFKIYNEIKNIYIKIHNMILGIFFSTNWGTFKWLLRGSKTIIRKKETTKAKT